MRRKGFKLEWNCFYHCWDEKEVKVFNIFYTSITDKLVKELVKKKIKNYEELYEFLRGEFFYHFCGKVEYEMLVSDLVFSEVCFKKIDVFYQIEPNLDRICEYVIRELRLDDKIFKK